MHACTMTYVPQIGYMLVVDPWDENETITEETEAIQGLPDMDFLFCAGGVPHFKTRRSRKTPSRTLIWANPFIELSWMWKSFFSLQVQRAGRGDRRHGNEHIGARDRHHGQAHQAYLGQVS